MPTTFLSLPRELRQNILFISHQLELTTPQRRPDQQYTALSFRKHMAATRYIESHFYVDHIAEGHRYTSLLRAIGQQLKQVHPALKEDADYVVGKWTEGVVKWLDRAEKNYREADTRWEKLLATEKWSFRR